MSASTYQHAETRKILSSRKKIGNEWSLSRSWKAKRNDRTCQGRYVVPIEGQTSLVYLHEASKWKVSALTLLQRGELRARECSWSDTARDFSLL